MKCYWALLLVMNMRKGRSNAGTVTRKKTWQQCIIKKAVQEAVPSGYALYAPPSAVSQEVRTNFLKDMAMQLLKDSEYLLGDANEQHGKDTNPSLNARELEEAYKKFMSSMNKLVMHHTKGRCFEVMLAQWAADRMDGFSTGVGDDDDDGDEFGMNISDSESEPALNEQPGEGNDERKVFGAPAGTVDESFGLPAS
ncbi:hypothetical protein JVT61DRAFT_6984 [Boletus reticuloceps]|uniref:Uncharacterized protein n=1 Tax=Boletus reticuloceps TaxID=495285 RepID=A0A8I2YJ98_9AGAM|nr:hypothetical protein JVT61DRAFT_6984 [Boletus reticuloceps]